MDAVSNDGDLILISIDKGIAFLVKKKTETVIKELNPGSMTPVEKVYQTNFYDFFIVIWESKVLKNISHLEHAGIPVNFVETEYETQQAIKNA